MFVVILGEFGFGGDLFMIVIGHWVSGGDFDSWFRVV